MKKIFYVLYSCLFLMTLTNNKIKAQTIKVENAKGIEKAAKQANPGDSIIVKPGRYKDVNITINAKGAKNDSITIMPQKKHSVVFTGKTKIIIIGKYTMIKGFNFEKVESYQNDDIIKFNKSDNCRVTECDFNHVELKGYNTVIAFESQATDNRIDHCKFDDIHTRSIRVVIDDNSLKNGPPFNNRIDHNIFKDIPPLGRNGGETIQVGSRAYPYSDLTPKTLIDNNIFLRADGEAEIISIKSTGNVVKNNKFLHSAGELSLRHGNANIIDGNLFYDCINGIRVSGSKHTITNNVIINSKNAGIKLLYGTPDLEHPAAYLPVYDCDISENIIEGSEKANIYVGALKNQHWHKERWGNLPYGSKNTDLNTTIAPYDNQIKNNKLINKKDKQIKLITSPDNVLKDNQLIDL